MRRSALIVFFAFAAICTAATPSRVTHPVNTGRTRTLAVSVHRLAQARFDRGAVEPSLRLDHITLMVKPSDQQRNELGQLITDQQNPSSPQFRKWLLPEEFADRFGLSPSDHSKIVAWLTGEGFQVKESARGRNWIAFSGTAGQVAKSLRAPIHRYQVDGETHLANAAPPAVPEALADVIDGFIGLDDFPLRSMARPVSAEYTVGSQHYLAPEDFATIYNITPLYQAGLDGAGQSIAIVGASAVSLNDIRSFRSRYNLPANDPKLLLYSTTDPGFNSAQIEGDLDLEWAGAIAPKATLYYVYGPSAFSALVSAINMNVAPVISVSYGACESDYGAVSYRWITQQANAQGITILVASGDSGAACDPQGSPIANLGRMPVFPASLPEVTSVGGTQFVEGDGSYWAATNTANFGSALSYIPEIPWNESSTINGILAGGGGASLYHPQPAWQRGAGVPNDGARHYPDMALTAAGHDAYTIYSQGTLGAVAGTSASAPAMAGIVALLNQSQINKGLQRQPGLGNINPQLYRLAQAAPIVFHDTITGNNIVPCGQGSPDCLTGSYGYEAGPGYDMASGLGSIDAEKLVNQWNTATNGVTVNLALSATRVAVNDTLDVTALVTAANGTPTGRVDFSIGGVPLGSATLVPRGIQGQAADLTFPVYQLGGTGSTVLTATYSGDAEFSTGGATRTITVIAGSGASAVTVSAPATVWPIYPDAQGLGWQTTITLREVAGVPSIVTGFTIDNQAQPLARYFPTPNIPGGGAVTVDVVFRNLTTPAVRKFGFTGVDSNGQTWARTVSVSYLGPHSIVGFNAVGTPLTVNRNPADPNCEWPVQLNIDELDGRSTTITALYAGTVDLTRQIAAIFGTARLNAWGSLQGTICFNGITPPGTSYIEVDGTNGFLQEVLLSFLPAPAAPAKITAAPATIALSSAKTQATIDLGISDKTQSWTAAVYPGNRMAGWLTVAPLAGTGPGQLTLSANGAGYTPGAYRATIVIQSPNAAPQYISVPVTFVLGDGAGTSITSVSNSASGTNTGAPGMLLSIYGSQLAAASQTATNPSPKPYTLGGVTAAVNGIAAPVLYVSATQVNIQIPFEAGAGPGVVGINNGGQIAGFPIQIAPAAPGIFVGSDGLVFPQSGVQAGKVATVYITGAGEATPAPTTAFAISPTTALASAPKPVLPLSITVGGVPAFVQTAGVAPGQVGMVQVNFIVPASAPAGPQPVVVTVGGVASLPANIVVQ